MMGGQLRSPGVLLHVNKSFLDYNLSKKEKKKKKKEKRKKKKKKKMTPVHFEALGPSETVLMHGNYQVIYQNNKYPDGLDLTKFL